MYSIYWELTKVICLLDHQKGFSCIICTFSHHPSVPSWPRGLQGWIDGHWTGRGRIGLWWGSREWRPQTSPSHTLARPCNWCWLSVPSGSSPETGVRDKRRQDMRIFTVGLLKGSKRDVETSAGNIVCAQYQITPSNSWLLQSIPVMDGVKWS